jgi:hypothetical protein
VERGEFKKSRKKSLSCNHRGFTFPAKKTEIGDKTKKGGKKGKPVTIGLMPVLTIDRYVFFFVFFFLADLSYVGFVLVSDFLDISDGKSISLFVSQNKSSPMDLFLS